VRDLEISLKMRMSEIVMGPTETLHSKIEWKLSEKVLGKTSQTALLAHRQIADLSSLVRI
jgi:hypothetical protein